MRIVRSGQWDADVLVEEMSGDVLGWLPAPADGVMHLSADKTRKDKRNRKLTNGKSVSDLRRYLPKSSYRRRAIHKPDGRRCDYWVLEKRATLHHLGDVTMVLSKKRRHAGPNQVRLFVSNLQDVNADTMLSLYAWRWAVGVSSKGHMNPVGESPTEVTSSSLVAWEALWREINTVKPSDTMLFGSMRNTPGCNVQ